MATLATSRTITYSDPPRVYVVSFEQGKKRGTVEIAGRAPLAWRWNAAKGLRNTEAWAQRIVASFAGRKQAPPLEEINAELTAASRQGSPSPPQPRFKTEACQCHEDRRLPVGDR